MQDSTRLPRRLIILEVIGIFFVLIALVLLNSGTELSSAANHHVLAKVSLFCGVILILPAVILLIWRTFRAMFPKLSGPK
ncbi:DUF1418 family protein [Tatumella citrea]|uniref:DUF1418 domain-containing protein n=1 Tax=Tatumella citrea TaxID=53336 RepID=A0A1Y0L636_TATCI|nr:DUF1418 family protein [Tatumella citrea]ARU93483.1 hypothetical protein A7K98_06625 [Tatumella citrea]ARU97522.1 hypothetical protein A7K99_06625 [Tatumella citrea]